MTNLPDKPWSVGDTFETERGLTYTFDGVRWLSDGQVLPGADEPPGRPFIFGSATKAGEFYADDSGNVYFNIDDLNGIRRVMPTYPDFTWATPRAITVWNEHGQLKYACEAGQTTDFKTDTIVFKGGKKLYNKGLTAGVTYYVTVEGYW